MLQLLPWVNNSLHVDDFSIYYISSNLGHAQRILTTAINRITTWATSIDVTFLVEKLLALFPLETDDGSKPRILTYAHMTPIKFCPSVKFQGFIFDNLNWKAHVLH